MTLAAVGQTVWPFRLPYAGAQSAFGTGSVAITFDSDTDRVAWVGTSWLSDDITTIYFRTGTVTTGCEVDVRVEGVSNGRPSGSLLDGASNIIVSIADSDDNVWKTATLTNPATVTPGLDFAIVIVVDTTGATPNLQFLRGPATGDADELGNVPILLQDTGAGTWAQLTTVWEAFCRFTTAGVVKLPMMASYDGSWGSLTLDADLSNDEVALQFVMPFACEIIGARVMLGNIGATADYTISLWPSSSTTDGDALRQKAYDGDEGGGTTIDGVTTAYWTPYTAAAGSTFYCGVRADTGTALVIFNLTTPAGISDSMLALGLPASVNQAARTWTAGSAGAWTAAANSFPFITLIVSKLDDGAGGSGGGGMVRVIA